MKVLLLGYSSIARRRVLPALRRLGARSIDIATRSAATVESPDGVETRVFHDYDAALRQTDAELVYVSTVNSGHAQWTRRALETGLHVVVDKPAFPSLDETHELLELADAKGLCLAESIVYYYHPQFVAAREVFREAGTFPTRIIAAFSFPPLPANNFRCRADLGGGALWDLGPYAMTPGRIFFEDSPTEISAWRLSANDQVDTSFSMAALYPGGRSCVGSFGYTTGYLNRLDVIGPGVVVTIDRAFSPPADMPLPLTVRRFDQVTTIQIPAADSFHLFLDDVLSTIGRHDHSSFRRRLLADAEALDRLRKGALEALDSHTRRDHDG